jgi:flagellar motility protein MotE (MotC chaperone)
MANIDADMEKATYGPIERFVYLILIPIIFTGILLVVLFSIFDYDVMNAVLRAVNKIPVVEKIVPDPPDQVALVEEKDETEPEDAAAFSPPEEEDVYEQLERQAEEVARLTRMNEEKDQYIEQLLSELERLENAQEETALDEEQYQESIQRLSSIYAKMMPSRAAAIMQNLTPAERVLILSEMKTNDQIRILEKMDAATAAETSILLKDTVPVRDRQINALQARLNEYVQREQEMPEALDNQELAQTIANMNAQSAAALLIEMRKANEQQVIAILRAMDAVSRSNILTAIAEQSEAVAAQVTARLAQ